MKTITVASNNSRNRSSCPLVLLFIAIALGCFALSPQAEATCLQGCDINKFNTFLGDDALADSNAGFNNTAIGTDALFRNTANNNTAIGAFTLTGNTTGFANTATGETALFQNSTGFSNTANGAGALNNNTTGNNNTAIGTGALSSKNAGSDNIALGSKAGTNLTEGSKNIYIGNGGVSTEFRTIRIGAQQEKTFVAGISGVTVAGGVGVIIDTNGQLGTVVSSARYKEAIKPMDNASEAILALKPVTFRYKHDLDPKRIPQFGLVAEDVEKVNPDLVARDDQGKPYTVRYEAVNAMLLNEFLKEHKKTEKLEETVASLMVTVKEQAAQIQKVRAQVELNKASPQTVLNNR